VAAASNADALRLMIETAGEKDVSIPQLAGAMLDLATGHALLGRCGTKVHRAAAHLILGSRVQEPAYRYPDDAASVGGGPVGIS
jgi:hypothetical protein